MYICNSEYIHAYLSPSVGLSMHVSTQFGPEVFSFEPTGRSVWSRQTRAQLADFDHQKQSVRRKPYLVSVTPEA